MQGPPDESAPVHNGYSFGALLRFELVAHAAHHLDQRMREALVDLLTQIVDINIDDVGECLFSQFGRTDSSIGTSLLYSTEIENRLEKSYEPSRHTFFLCDQFHCAMRIGGCHCVFSDRSCPF